MCREGRAGRGREVPPPAAATLPLPSPYQCPRRAELEPPLCSHSSIILSTYCVPGRVSGLGGPGGQGAVSMSTNRQVLSEGRQRFEEEKRVTDLGRMVDGLSRRPAQRR